MVPLGSKFENASFRSCRSPNLFSLLRLLVMNLFEPDSEILFNVRFAVGKGFYCDGGYVTCDIFH